MTTRVGRRLGVAAAALAVLVAAGVLVAAIVTAAHRDVEPWGGGATLRPLAADEGMGDDQAYAVAKSTVRLWVRERNAANIPNVLALTCRAPLPGLLPADVELLQTNGRPPDPWEVLGTGAFTRPGRRLDDVGVRRPRRQSVRPGGDGAGGRRGGPVVRVAERRGAAGQMNHGRTGVVHYA